jgi:hypothetical protein
MDMESGELQTPMIDTADEALFLRSMAEELMARSLATRYKKA